MVQGRDGACLPGEALRECALRSLDGDEAVEAGVAGLVDFAHAAGSYGREDFVGSEIVA
jgi:hypothetical protein